MLQALFINSALMLELNGGGHRAGIAVAQNPAQRAHLVPGDRVRLHLRRDLLAHNCP